ncbi:MAG: response regulator [Nanoarchaeota archaeon]|nr:response regulator [Nanoarchaeota archaeon]
MKKKTILVVEDDPEMQSIYKEMLESDYDLIIADNSRKARSLLEANKVDLMILDIILPDETGDSFLAHLKKMPRFENLQVLAITVLGDLTYELCKIDPKIIGVAKPFDRKKLLKIIKEVI